MTKQFSEMKKDASNGDAEASYKVGKSYYYGDNVAKDYARARKYLRMAAEAGIADAALKLGKCCYYGWGGPKDYSLAREWFKQAAEAGIADAALKLGKCYEHGWGGNKDYAAALKWFKRAAEGGDSEGALRLGKAYYYGKHTELDYAQAEKWLKQAAKGNKKDAKKILPYGIPPYIKVAGTDRRVRPQKGDVIAVTGDSHLYAHFGVYVGDEKVIHYAAKSGEFGLNPSIHETTLTRFLHLRRAQILVFPEDSGAAKRDPMHAPTDGLPEEPWFFDILREKKYHLYSPDETVERARKRVGETKYNLLWNNCEHFALWCKTGVSESQQVNQWLGLLLRMMFR